jgi:16S rRNA (guanine527-N7)-methyltransferase
MSKITEILRDSLIDKKTKLSDEQYFKLSEFNDFLQQENKKHNLTAITNEKSVAIRHFLDSLMLAECKWFQKAKKILDIGSGAGFPGIPLAIAYPDKEFFLVDSLRKRVDFINQAVDMLKLDNVIAIHDRAETFSREESFRETFDFVTARAVAEMAILSEYCLPATAIGGHFVSMKLTDSDDELEKATSAIEILGGKIVDSFRYQLPDDKEYELIVIEKVFNTPDKYPRRPGMPKKRPLL